MEDFDITTVSPASTRRMHEREWVRVIVMIVCVLSMLGAALIILSYLCWKDLRSKGRQILFHISIMDFGVGLSNVYGASVYFSDHYNLKSYYNCSTFISNLFVPSYFSEHTAYSSIMCPESKRIQTLCLAQAVLSSFFTYASIFWTLSLSFYLYFRIVHRNTLLTQYSLVVSYFLCYGIPILLALWMLLTGRLGFAPYESAGWCSIILNHPATGERDIFAATFGYNIWIVMTFIFSPILACVTRYNVRKELRHAAMYHRSDEFRFALHSIDYKFLLIPLFFIFLRLWSFIEDIVYVYIGVHHVPEVLAVPLTLLGGIGDSGQGITNALLFFIFTKKMKDKCNNCFTRSCPSSTKMLNIQASMHAPRRTTSYADTQERKSLIEDSDGSSVHYSTSLSYEHASPEPYERD